MPYRASSMTSRVYSYHARLSCMRPLNSPERHYRKGTGDETLRAVLKSYVMRASTFLSGSLYTSPRVDFLVAHSLLFREISHKKFIIIFLPF